MRHMIVLEMCSAELLNRPRKREPVGHFAGAFVGQATHPREELLAGAICTVGNPREQV